MSDFSSAVLSNRNHRLGVVWDDDVLGRFAVSR